jgi:AraC-like DNA-binding protein
MAVGAEAQQPFDSLSKNSMVTLVDPKSRSLISAATDGAFVSIHTDHLESARKALENRQAHVLLLSPNILKQEELKDLAVLIAKYPEVLSIAVLHRDGFGVSERVLELGKCGITRIVDLEQPNGCANLRATLEECGNVITRRILAGITSRLQAVTPASLNFFALLVRAAPTHATARELARLCRMNPSSLASHFFRAKLPSPKEYVVRTRLLYASSYLESPRLSIATVALRLEYSSPQSFGRHVRSTLGITASAFRARGFDIAMEDYTDRLICGKEIALSRLRFFEAIA